VNFGLIAEMTETMKLKYWFYTIANVQKIMDFQDNLQKIHEISFTDGHLM